MTWKLKRLHQCDKCPWKVTTDPREIPDGYSEDLHRALLCTIAEPGASHTPGGIIVAMGCHQHDTEEQVHCVGWLMNQINQGNNIPLRIQMMTCENARHIRLDGEQHEDFRDTLPNEDL